MLKKLGLALLLATGLALGSTNPGFVPRKEIRIGFLIDFFKVWNGEGNTYQEFNDTAEILRVRFPSQRNIPIDFLNRINLKEGYNLDVVMPYDDIMCYYHQWNCSGKEFETTIPKRLVEPFGIFPRLEKIQTFPELEEIVNTEPMFQGRVELYMNKKKFEGTAKASLGGNPYQIEFIPYGLKYGASLHMFFRKADDWTEENQRIVFDYYSIKKFGAVIKAWPSRT